MIPSVVSGDAVINVDCREKKSSLIVGFGVIVDESIDVVYLTVSSVASNFNVLLLVTCGVDL